MNGRAVLVALLLVAALGLALPAVAQESPTASNDANQSDNATVDNVTLGQSISGFMQSTAAGTESEVDQGLYQAQYEIANESDRPALVENRTERLDARLAAIEERIERIRERRDELNPTAYRAQMSAAATQLRAIEVSANATERDAVANGVNTTRLEQLRQHASVLGGGEVAAIARNLTGVPDDVPGRGPPDDAGPDDPGQPNGTDGGEGNEPGAPDDRGNGTDGAGTGGQGTGNGTGGQDAGTGTGGQGTGTDGAGTGSGDQGTGTGGQGTGTGGQGTGTGAQIVDTWTGGQFWSAFGI